MRRKIQNQLLISCSGVDLTEISNIEFYVRQTMFFGCYKPSIISSDQMTVTIPFEDARRLNMGEVKLQFAFVDRNGIPDASDIVAVSVKDFLKEVGYDPI